MADERAIALLTLRKLFADMARGAPISSQSSKDIEAKVTKLLPSFAKVIVGYQPDDIQFKELAPLTGYVARYFVQEIRKRASNQSTEDAAVGIVEFLQPSTAECTVESCDELWLHYDCDDVTNYSRGWLLLNGLNWILRTNTLTAVEAACAAALPSTIAKSLYLFYDLPASRTAEAEVGSSTEVRYRRMREGFTQLACRLCSHSCAGEELTRKDDLSLVFSGASSWCPQENIAWRKVTSELLMVISARILTQTVIAYVHAKSCIAQYVENVRHLEESGTVSVEECVEMVICLFCVLKDSGNVTGVLLEDFKAAGGYEYLTQFLMKPVPSTSTAEAHGEALRNLLLMFSTFVTAGEHELRCTPPSSQLFTMGNFQLPQPVGHGCSVRNVDAFRILEQVFVASSDPQLCSSILDVVQSIYVADPANYFLLDSECSLAKFVEVINTKGKPVQVKLFELIEYVVYHLNHIPCKELLALGVVLKMETNLDSSTCCIESLFRILSFNPIFRDVYREVSLLETFTYLLQTHVDRVIVEDAPQIPEADKSLSLLVIEILTVSLKEIFRECEGTRLIGTVLSYDQLSEYHAPLLRITQQLLMLVGGEEHLAQLLTLLHTWDGDKLVLRMTVLKSLLTVLRESHRVRVAFRRVGGYLCLMSLLLSLEGVLTGKLPYEAPWCMLSMENDSTEVSRLLIEFVQLVFKVLTISMRFEPSNAKFFQTDVRFDSVTVSLRLTGAFESCDALTAGNPDDQASVEDYKEMLVECHGVFVNAADEIKIPSSIPLRHMFALCFVRYLYNMALDQFDRAYDTTMHTSVSQSSMSTSSVGQSTSTYLPTATDAVIVHPRALMCILDLLPGVAIEEEPKWSTAVQIYVCEVLKSMMRSERNQQVMSDATLPRHLFTVARALFACDNHILLPTINYILERMSAQAMQPRELREFLRLDLPLCCRPLDERNPYLTDGRIENSECVVRTVDTQTLLPSEGGHVPLNRVKALVSMMTPRDYNQLHPAFVEFDMNIEGFACVFLPSIAPTQQQCVGNRELMDNVATSSGGGGVGTGERVFPPANGLTFMTWVNVQHYSGEKRDAHPVRLLTLTRSVPADRNSGGVAVDKVNRRTSTLTDWFSVATDMTAVSPVSQRSPSNQPSGGNSTHVDLACLTIQISSVDHTLLISTHESDAPGADLDHDTSPTDSHVRVAIPELREEQHWCHLTVVLHRAVLKQSTVSVYVNAKCIFTHRLHYIATCPGGYNSSLQPIAVNATIGTPPGAMRKQSKLVWRLAATHLLEEVLNPEQINYACALGPDYTGSFQTVQDLDDQCVQPLISDERICFGVNAQAVSQMTIARLRRIYNKTDSKLIAKYLGISTNENATPIRVLHNSAGHLNGTARSLGGVLIGYLGIRTFTPHPVTKLLESIGGTNALLGLVAMSVDSEGLYASLKALLCAVKNNDVIAGQMDANRGYQTLAFHLKDKSSLLNSHILHLVFALIGTLDSTRESNVIPNPQAFEDLICDLNIWANAPLELQRLLYEHCYELITESGEQRENLKFIRGTPLLHRLLCRLKTHTHMLHAVKDILFKLLAAILQPLPESAGLLKFGQFIASTLTVSGAQNVEQQIPFELKDIENVLFDNDGTVICSEDDRLVYDVYVRNRCLNILATSMVHTSSVLNQNLCDQVVKVLGFDWVTALLVPRSHPATVLLALRILSALLLHPHLAVKFRDGSICGGWLRDAETVVQNRAGVLLGFSVSAHGGPVGPAIDVNGELCALEGCHALAHALSQHAQCADAYLSVLSILVGRANKELEHVTTFDLDTVWECVFNLPANDSVSEAIANTNLCCEAVLPLFAMLHTCIAKQLTTEQSKHAAEHWSRRNAQTCMQFVTFLYHNCAQFAAYCGSETFLCSLVATLLNDGGGGLEGGGGGGQTEYNDMSSDTSSSLISASCGLSRQNTMEQAAVPSSPPHKQSPSPTCDSEHHPTRKQVIELLKNILIDSFHTTVPGQRLESPLDIVLECLPDTTSSTTLRVGQTQLITSLFNACMEHIVASELLTFMSGSTGTGQHSPHGTTSGTTAPSTVLMANVFYFATRVTDCVWNGQYSDNESVVFDFLLKLMTQARRRSGGSTNVTDSLMICLNRTILHQLSKAVDGHEAQLKLVDALHKVHTHKSLVFGNAAIDPDFYMCLTHLLFMLNVRPDKPPPSPNPGMNDVSVQSHQLADGFIAVANAAERVWSELYLTQKQLLEDRCKVGLVPEMNAARSLIGDSCSLQWQNFVDLETKGPQRDLSSIHMQLQSKLQKVTSSLQKLTARTRALAGAAPGSQAMSNMLGVAAHTVSQASGVVIVDCNTKMTLPDAQMWTRVHIGLIRELVRVQGDAYSQWHDHVARWCYAEWHKCEEELTRQRGLWGPEWGSELDKFHLDSTEGPNRQRRKLMPNANFYIDYPYRPALDLAENKSLRSKTAISTDSQNYYERVMERRPRTLDGRIFDDSLAPSKGGGLEPFSMVNDVNEVNTSMIRRVSLQRTATVDSDSAKLRESDSTADLENLEMSAENDETFTMLEDEGETDDKVDLSDKLRDINIADDDDLHDEVVGEGQEERRAPKPKAKKAPKLKHTAMKTGPADVPTSPTSPPGGMSKQMSVSHNQAMPRGPDNQTLLRLLEEGEELQSMFRCARIQGLESSEGLLLFGRDHYYVVDGYTLLKTREIRDLDYLPEELHDPIVPYMAMGSTRPERRVRVCSKFSYEDIREVHKRRYLLQPNALEVFSMDGRNYLLAFPKRMRNRVNAKFVSVARSMADADHSVSGQRSDMSLDQQAGKLSLITSLIGETSVSQRWCRGEISNFQYLMHLNTLAGRSYNDFSQYPVFPWVLADYESDELDLTDPKTFRDLSKPMGALSPDRLEQFLKRYREWDDPTGETPPYMYGTHYSSAMIVVSYMVRVEPFTQQFLKLQGGHFDLADRMFHSIRDAWVSASKNNMADVKELIPEFFYLPEIMMNHNKFDFGTKQNGISLDNVLLPPWAKNDPHEFIRKHREALECDHVSANLHHWIDLIFGARQKGATAAEASNVFHHLFYEGNVDFDLIDDPLTRNATIGFVNNFGQIPAQLFKKTHPPKKSMANANAQAVKAGLTPLADPLLPTPGVTTGRLFFHALDSLKPPQQPMKTLRGAVGQILQTERNQLCCVEQNKTLMISPDGATARYIAWGYADRSLRLGVVDGDRSCCVHELSEYGEIVCAACPNNRTVITGSTNTVVNVWELVGVGAASKTVSNGRLKLRKSLYGHTDSVTCLAANGQFGMCVSGSRDGTCIVWCLSSLTLIRQLGPHSAPVSALAINESTGDMASASGTHLYVWTVNGELMATVNSATSPKLQSKQQILSLCFSNLNEWDPSHIIAAGSNDGVTRFWSMEFVQVPEFQLHPAETCNPPDVISGPPMSAPAVGGIRNPFAMEFFHERLQRHSNKLMHQNSGTSTMSFDLGNDSMVSNMLLSSGAHAHDAQSLGQSSAHMASSSWSVASGELRDFQSTAPTDAQGSGSPTSVTAGNPSLEHQQPSGDSGIGSFPRPPSGDSFPFINRDGVLTPKYSSLQTCKLRAGFKWQRQLVFRNKLTMHTAYERKDNVQAAAVTAIAPSRDHKSLYIGDSLGRVWQWTVGEPSSSGGRADHWVQDTARSQCTQCQQRFTIAERKHHCRNCGHIFCAKCSRFESELRHMKITKPVRVCQSCFLRLKAELT